MVGLKTKLAGGYFTKLGYFEEASASTQIVRKTLVKVCKLKIADTSKNDNDKRLSIAVIMRSVKNCDKN